MAGKPESEVKRKESGRRSPEPNTDGAGEPESGSRVAGNFEEDFVVTPPVTPQVPPPEAGGNAGSGSRVAGSPNQARKVEQDRKNLMEKIENKM